jgi:hypothetical protein
MTRNRVEAPRGGVIHTIIVLPRIQTKVAYHIQPHITYNSLYTLRQLPQLKSVVQRFIEA